MYAKLTGNTLRQAPKRVTWHGRTVDNPTPDILRDLGYLPVTYTDPPTDAPDGQHYESSWTQMDTEILQQWKLVDDPAPPEPTAEERMDSLEAQQERTDAALQEVILAMMGGE